MLFCSRTQLLLRGDVQHVVGLPQVMDREHGLINALLVTIGLLLSLQDLLKRDGPATRYIFSLYFLKHVVLILSGSTVERLRDGCAAMHAGSQRRLSFKHGDRAFKFFNVTSM